MADETMPSVLRCYADGAEAEGDGSCAAALRQAADRLEQQSEQLARVERLVPSWEARGARSNPDAAACLEELEQSLRPAASEPELTAEELIVDEYPGPVLIEYPGRVLITHKPTLLQTECKAYRSTIKNKAEALRMLRERLRELNWSPAPTEEPDRG